MSKLADMKDEALRAYYESVRRQVAADEGLGGRYRLAGTSVREYADRLKDEMTRHMAFNPIQWPMS